MKVAFTTYEGFPNLTDDDRLAADALASRGFQVDGLLWSDPKVDWSGYQAVIIRSCWDYHLKPDKFRAWLDRLDRDHVTLWNPIDVVRWNIDKSYLNDLMGRGVPVLETVWVSNGEKADLHNVMQLKGWSKAVVKPMISAAAKGTEVIAIDRANERQRWFKELAGNGGAIIQAFAEEIQTAGEWSLIFFDKRFSHAVLKRPKDGDFRVQRDFGGTAHLVTPPGHLIAQAQKIIDGVETDLLYARVDGIERQGTLYLMELELIEPYLFFELEPEATGAFVSAFLDRIMNRPEGKRS